MSTQASSIKDDRSHASHTPSHTPSMPADDVERAAMDKEQEPPARPAPAEAPAAAYDNPRAWPTSKKIRITAISVFMTLALTYSSSAYTSSTEHIIAEFGVSRTVALLGIALFVLGFAFGPLLFGPLAHVFGHRPVFIVTYVCFTAMSFGASEAPNIQALVIFRFFAGVFGSSSLNNAPATIGDVTLPANASKFLLFYALMAFGGPGLAPVIASFIDARAGWRWNMRVQAIFVAATTIACILFYRETNHTVLQARASERQAEKTSPGMQWQMLRKTMKRALSGPFVWLFGEPVVMIICFYLSLLYTILYLTFLVIPLVFLRIRGFSQESNGLIFVSLLVGFLFAFVIFAVMQQSYTMKVLRSLPAGEEPSPETRLRQAIWASSLPPIGLFIFAWTAPFPHVHWIGACFGMFTFTFGMFIVFTSFIPYLVAYGGNDAPLLLAASTFTRSLMAAAFPIFGVQMFNAMTIQGGCSMLAGVCLLLTPLPALLTKYGPALRAKSKRK